MNIETAATSENFIFENPTYIMRVCKEDGRPTMGSKSFIWPKSGPVEDPNFVDNGQCGGGLFGCRPSQILDGMWHLRRGDFPIFLICEVEEAEISDLREKCKFPRCNVVYSGTWQGCLQILSKLGLDDVPSEAEFMARAGWHRASEQSMASLISSKEKIIPDEQNTVNWRELQYGDLINPVTLAERARATDYIRTPFGERMTTDQAKWFGEIMRRVNATERMSLWARLQKNIDNLFAVHPYIEQLMVRTAESNVRITWPVDEENVFKLPETARHWVPEDRYKARENCRAHSIAATLKGKAIERAFRKEALAKAKALHHAEQHFYDWRE